jgi:hypothetical protein
MKRHNLLGVCHMTGNIRFRAVSADDLPFFSQQQDAAASHMAAFAVRNPADREASMARWSMILGDDTIAIQTIVHKGRVAGYILKHEGFG